MNPVYDYLLIINAIGLLIMLVDKINAIRNKIRIPEKILLGIGLLGGSLGCTLGMLLFRHKTRKIRFMIGFPAMLCLHIILLTGVLFIL